MNPLSRSSLGPGGVEEHHIVPLHAGGSDDPVNRVFLTAREHYFAHLLLMKIAEAEYGKESDEYMRESSAVIYFGTCVSNEKLKGRRSAMRVNSRFYKSLRKAFGAARSVYMTGRFVGEKNGMYGRRRTADEKRRISETRKFRKCSAGDRNPMYGRPCHYKMT